jgi:hypothetical protein
METNPKAFVPYYTSPVRVEEQTIPGRAVGKGHFQGAMVV